MMGKRGTVVLLVLFFGGLGALWWARESGVPTAGEREERAGRVLPQLMKVEPGEVARIEVEDPQGGGAVALERRGGGWQLVEPIDALADRRRAEALVNNLIALRKAPEAGGVSGEASRFGLEPPGRVIRLFREGASEPLATLALGDELERLRYVRPEGGPIALADALRVEPNDVDPMAWRERGLFDLYSYDVKALNVVGPGRRLNVVLDGGRWRIVHPFRGPANAEAINGLLADLADLEAIAGAEGFAAEDVEDLSPFGLDPEQATIVTLLPAGLTGPAEPQVAYLGHAPEGKADLRYARREGQDDVLLVRARGVGDLGADPLAVRSRKVVDFRPAEVEALQVEAGGRTYRLAKGAEGWAVVEPGEGTADALDVATLLETLVGLESATFFRAGEVEGTGLDAPAAAIAAWLDRPEPGDEEGPAFERPANARLRIGRYDAGRKLVFGQLDGDEGTVLALPETVRALIPEGALAYRDRTLVRQDPRGVRRVELTRPGRSLTLERQGAPVGVAPSSQAAWRVVAPEEAPADRLATTMLVEALSRLRAERWAEGGAGEASAFGLDAPAIRVAWEDGSGESGRRELSVGGPVAGHPEERYARLGSEPGVFTIGPKLLAVLAAEFRDRRMLAFAAERATRIAIRGGGGGELAFVRAASGGWEPEAGADAWPEGVDAGRIDALAATLAGLTADRIVQDAGPMPEGSGLEPPDRIVEVGLSDPDGSVAVRLGKVVGTHRFAAIGTGGAGAAYLIPADLIELPGETETPPGEEGTP